MIRQSVEIEIKIININYRTFFLFDFNEVQFHTSVQITSDQCLFNKLESVVLLALRIKLLVKTKVLK